ncbi:hypothetical protein FQN54_007303 [Arachnomyces sp. PD_36]|nr:hypothetical protein FQN54_007303 [Arachnomyces sp. PD_36]
MARLNDIGAPSESIEALKRRFVRQNREIARANSVQSLRIRTLEADVSRLLAENISLRERIITLDQEVEKFNSVPFLGDGVNEVKGKLAAKLEELNTLVGELGSLPQIMKKPPTSIPPPETDEHTSLERPNPPPRRQLFGGDGYDDGRLPAILEDKYYPRKTLDAQEIQDVLEDNFDESQSPDIGPPPIVHFDEFDSNSPSFEEQFKSNTFEDDICDPSDLPPNLETRKKKRDVLFRSDDWGAGESPRSDFLKAGSKRKLSVRDDDEPAPQTLDEPDDFQYNLSADKPRDEIRRVRINNGSRPTVAKTDSNAIQGSGVTARKPLGPKNVNMNPSSPKKQKQPISAEEEVDLKKAAPKPSKSREQKASRKRDPVTKSKPKQKEPQGEVTLTIPDETCPKAVDVQLPPKTPAADDIFSPDTTEPPTSKQKSRDTPPPPELTSLTPGTAALNAETRPSRRPRTAVSYAEPSLRGKMRRSTKELTDAVGEDRFRRTSQVERVDSEEPNSGAEKKKVRTVSVKREEADDSSWKSLAAPEATGEEKDPTSPLGDRSAAQSTELPSSVMTKRKRRTLSSNTFDMPEGPSSSSIAISTLVANSKKSSNGRRSKEDTGNRKDTREDDAHDYIAPYEDSGHRNGSDDKLEPTTKRQSRRLSSKPNDLLQENPAPRKHTFMDSFDDDSDTRRKEDDNFTFSRLEDKEADRDKRGDNVTKERRKVGRPKRDSSVDPLATSDSSQHEEQVTRAQRSASRRRSMMV